MAKTQVIDQLVRRYFPHPIAASWHRAALATSHSDRTKRLLVCQEVIARTLVAMLLPDYLRGEPDSVVEQQITRLGRPSLGHWVGLMRSMLRHLRKREDPGAFIPEATDWYFKKGRPSANAKLFDALVEVRNAEAHGHALSDTEAGERATRLLADMRQLLGDLDWLAGYRMFRIHNAQLARRGGFQGMVQFLTGLEPQTEPQHASWTARLFPEAVYLASPTGEHILELSPFIQVLFDPGPRGERVFMLNGTRKGKMVVLQNDATGARENRLVVTDEGEVPIDQWLEERGEHLLHQANTGDSLAAPHWQVEEADEEILGGRFEVRATLGSGGMATVFLVWDQWEEAEYALKVLNLQLAEERDFRERFKREARTMRRLRHDHILPVEETSQLDDGRLYLKLPVMSGGTLREQIVAGAIAEEQQVRWARQMLSGIEYLHAQGVTHRDIKPSNYLLDDAGNVLLSDFGIALRETDTRLTKAMDQIGSVAYMSPEQRRGGEAENASDIYSLGVVLHELATGVEGVVDPGEGIEGVLAPLVRAMCQTDPDARPTATEALAMLPGGATGKAPPPTPEIPAVAERWYQNGPHGQLEGSLDEVVAAIREQPAAQHLLWQPGWTGWKPWTEVEEVRAAVEQTAPTAAPVVAPPPVDEVGGIGLDLVDVSAGTWEMDGRPTTLTRGFALGRSPVTQALWEVVMEKSPSAVFDSAAPVDSVAWVDVVRFCNALSERTGLTPVYGFGEWVPRKTYSVDAMGRALYDLLPFKLVAPVLAHFGEETLTMLQHDPMRLTEVPGVGDKTAQQVQSGWDPWKYFSREVTWDRDADGYRLPTEAEWVRGLDTTEAGATERQEWLWDLDRGPWFHPEPVAIAADAVTDPVGAEEGPRRMLRSAEGRACLDPLKREATVTLRIARNA